MGKAKNLFGVVPIVPTPFKENEEIDEKALRDLIEFAIASGIQSVCLPAYASEFYKLSDEEKLKVVKIAVDQAAGRIQIVAQSNSPSLKIAIQLAKANVAAGADVISLAVPRIFNLPEASLKQYLGEFLKSIPETPVLIQDFNPGGASLSVQFINQLRLEFSNFKYLKLEEPLCASKIREIIKTTEAEIGVLEGWGGLYLLELIPAGIVGVMPGLAVADVLQQIFLSRRIGENDRAFELFERVMPQIFFLLTKYGVVSLCRKRITESKGSSKKQHRQKSCLYTR